MSADALLARLEGVRKTGPDRWIARCPAHADGRPSLSLSQKDNGLVLFHCFAGCSAQEVLDALAMEFADLFPQGRVADHRPRERRPIPHSDILRALAHESIVLHLYANRMARGEALEAADRKRLLLAASRMNAAVNEYAS